MLCEQATASKQGAVDGSRSIGYPSWTLKGEEALQVQETGLILLILSAVFRES